MNKPVNGASPFTSMPNEVNLHILSFLDNRSLQALACTSKQFNELANDFQIWKPRTELEFGRVVTLGAKQANKSWRETYDELDSSRKVRIENAAEIIQSQIRKIKRDNIQYRTATAASAFFGFAMPNPSTHYYPTGQVGFLGNRKIIVFKSTPQ